MKQRQAIIEKLEATINLKNLCRVYEELSVLEMQKIKDSVIASRDFYSALSEVYVRVKQSYQNHFVDLLKKKGVKNPKKMLIFGKNEKSVSVLITANSRLYGRILQQTCELFLESARKEKCDLVVIGELGKELLKNFDAKLQFQYFFVPDYHLETQNLQELLNYLVQYKKINIFYGFYQTLFNQSPVVSNITGDAPLLSPLAKKEQSKYIFEPDLKNIMMFFEKHILSSLFLQTVFDSYLSRLASRITSMEESIDRIINEENILKTQKRRFIAYDENKKQMERLAGMSLWV